ncbi:MAG: type II toxin-antitoxin system ParD family antitoxin [Sphingobium sp.]|jgi:antitoxin ParD1/3/4|uniref:ribbon-helix-helix domain-containing protein n=1 Tax=Sphingobium sp. TaxID=1912891 RepID=UPI0029B90806|nr:type II toxin-antitoxin system ParD family antitoxin [Sphingobium sp.]MDX3910148.1 type II toxin-antitoxin system ParD family antitoxin [Sphingobium sp.]
MPAHHTLHVVLTRPLVEYVRSQVLDGQYSNASQVVRAAIELHAKAATERPVAPFPKIDAIDD